MERSHNLASLQGRAEVARAAHNRQVVGSIPNPATNLPDTRADACGALYGYIAGMVTMGLIPKRHLPQVQERLQFIEAAFGFARADVIAPSISADQLEPTDV